MGEEKGKCKVCKTEYKKSEWGVCDDSHVTYTTKLPCPKCGYNEALEEEIEEILNEKTVISGRPGGQLEINQEALLRHIMRAVVKSWSKRKRKGKPISRLN
jgi:hypothetical protein